MIILILSIVIVLITGLAVWLDHRIYQNRVRGIMIVLSGVLLLGFITEPKWWPSETGRYALITDGFEAENFKANRYDQVFSLRLKDKYITGKTWLSSVAMIVDEIQTGSEIDLLGFGMNEELPGEYRWIDELQEPGKGVGMIEAPLQVEVGKSFEFSVMIKGSAEGDSIQVYKDGEFWADREVGISPITFKDQLNMKGPTTYDFEWMSEDSLYAESLNIRAVQPELLTFGILIYSPSFEVNYLAEHFGNRGHTVISRSRIGKERFRFDAINANQGQAESILDQLASMDVLILDSREYSELQLSEKERIREAIKMGLDVMVTAPQTQGLPQWQEVMSELTGEVVELQPLNRLEERNWVPEIVKNDMRIINALPLSNVDFSKIPASASVIHQYSGNEPVSLKFYRGSGSVTGQLFYRTYGWLLEGESVIYNRFWVDHLSRIITVNSPSIEVAPAIPKRNEKVEILITQPSKMEPVIVKPAVLSDTLRIPVLQHAHNKEVISASFWPQESGWHFAEYGDQKKWFYVYENGWKNDSSINNYIFTKNQIIKLNANGTKISERSMSKVPDWFWLLGFLVIQFFLWAERKI